MSLSITVDGLEDIAAKVRELGDVDRLLEPIIAAHLEVADLAFARETAPDGTAWAALAPSTLEDATRSGGILEKTGAMRRSVEGVRFGDDEGAVGSPLVRAGVHLSGRRARPFLGAISPDTLDEIVREHLRRAVRVIDLRNEYVARFGDLPGVRSSAPHDEDFGTDELRRVGVGKMPAVYVVHLDTPVTYTPGLSVVGVHRWAAVVFAAAASARALDLASRGDVAALVAHRIAYELEAGVDFTESHERPADVRVRNAATAATAAAGVAVYVVTWEQSAPIVPADIDLVLADLDIVVATITPDEGPETIATAGTVTVIGETGERIDNETGDDVVGAEGI